MDADGEAFYGVTLSEKEPLTQFEMSESEKVVMDQKLVIKQIILGADAKEGEFNVVEVETRGAEKDTLKIPVAVLRAGETRSLKPNIEFASGSVTFKLIKGTGPVHIHGQHVINEAEVEDGYYEEEEGDEYDDEEQQEPHSSSHTNGNGNEKNANSFGKRK